MSNTPEFDKLPAAARFAYARFGGSTRLLINPLGVAGVAGPVLLLPNDPDRVFWEITNLGPSTLYTGFDALVNASTGTPLYAAGGFQQMLVEEDGEAVTYPVWGTSPGLGATPYILVVRLDVKHKGE